MEYCISVWGDIICSSKLKPLDAIIKRAARHVLDQFSLPPYDLLRNLQWLDIVRRVKLSKVCFIYKILHGLVQGLEDGILKIKPLADRKYLTRQVVPVELEVDRPRINLYKNSVSFIGAKTWNEFGKFHNSPTYFSFRKTLKSDLLSDL